MGSSTIQLARASGVEVVATASSRNFEYVKQLGVSAVYDYTSREVADTLVGALKDSHCIGGFDTIGSNTRICAEILARIGGGHIATTLEPPERLPDGVTANHGAHMANVREVDILTLRHSICDFYP